MKDPNRYFDPMCCSQGEIYIVYFLHVQDEVDCPGMRAAVDMSQHDKSGTDNITLSAAEENNDVLTMVMTLYINFRNTF